VVSTRVLLVDMPLMLREIVRGLVEREPDMEVVCEVADPLPSVEAVAASDADVVIVGGSGGEVDAACRDLLAERPALVVVALSADGRSCAFYDHHHGAPRTAELGEVAPVRLLAVVREAMRGELNRKGS
jgi:DNA-binding NarL/FixJ family response regulator